MWIDTISRRTPLAAPFSIGDSPKRFNICRSVAVAAGGYALLGGAVTLLGWALAIQRLTDWADTGISMFANTALCAGLSGVGLILLSRSGARAWRRNAVRTCALFVSLLGGLTLFQHISDLNLGIDTLLVDRPWGQRAAAAPMRMGLPASTSFAIVGAGLFLATFGQRARRIASIFATFAVAISSLSLIGYWFGSDQLYTIVHLTGIAIQTSSILAALGVGLMASVPEHGIVSLLCREDAGGILVRRLLLPIIAVPLLLGWLRVLGEAAGLYDTGFGRSVLLLSMIAMLLTLLALTASSISRKEQALREREQRYELVLVGAEAAIWDWDVVRKRVLYSPRWKQLRGLSDEEISDSEEEWRGRIHPEDRQPVMAAVEAHFNGRTPVFAEEYRVRHKHGCWVWVLGRGIARRDAAGQVVRMAGSETDISERKQLEEELRQRLAELADADSRKNQFIATLAHELRNPLAPIRNSLQLLRWSKAIDPSVQNLQDVMERQVNHMVRLVDDLLEVTRISSGKIELRTEPVDISTVLESALETSKPLIEAGGHQLTMTMPQEAINVVADAVRLSQVVANLLNNAAKYTEPGGEIWLAAWKENGHVVISVRDTGVGISPAMLPQIFEMFAQADKDHKRAQGGLGIGLALAKSLIELHGGRIEAKSDGEHRGSEFVIRLPIDERQPAISNGATSENLKNPLSTSARVLVVDDNVDAAGSLAMLLTALGNEVETANDGVAALEAIRSFQPSIVLLDLGMPGMSGYEVASRARAMPEGKQSILVALTGWGQADDRRRTREAGFNHHLTKPVEVGTLKRLLSDVQAQGMGNGSGEHPAAIP